MDWLEEKAGKLREYLKDAGLVRSLIYYLCISSIGAVALWLFTRNICNGWMEVIDSRMGGISYHYPALGGKIVISQIQRYEKMMKILSFIYNYSLWVYMLIAYMVAGKIFFARKLAPALGALEEMLHALNAGDYSREIVYRSSDEMGKIAEMAEELRKKLIQEKQRQWERQEEQREINAAFAHDIRTPLTVIRGYTEFLQKYVPQNRVSEELLMEKLDTMHYQEERLLRFSNTMTELQRIEKREISCRWVKLSELMQRLKETAEAMEETSGKVISLYEGQQDTDCGHCEEISGKTISRYEGQPDTDCNHCEETSEKTISPYGRRAGKKEKQQELFVDVECVQEVVENLLNNAVRYAGKLVVMQVEVKRTELTIYVKDDGKGFSQRALRAAAEAYFSEEKESGEHFGIGLSICKMLCENHNGNITFQNSVEGGAIAAAVFGIGVKE